MDFIHYLSIISYTRANSYRDSLMIYCLKSFFKHHKIELSSEKNSGATDIHLSHQKNSLLKDCQIIFFSIMYSAICSALSAAPLRI